MIPAFPKFTKLKLAQKNEIENITKNFKPYSDFNFVSLYSWNIDDSTQVSLLNNNLVIKLHDYIDRSSIYSILGDKMLDYSAEQLFSETRELNLVPTVVASQLKKDDKYSVTKSRDNNDYVYSIDKLIGLNGSALKKKRNRLNSFRKQFDSQLSVRTSNKLSAGEIKNISLLTEEWSKNSPSSQDEIKNEGLAINRLLRSYNKLGLVITEIRINNVLCAYSINEVIDNKYALCHFEKALLIHPDIYICLVSETAKSLKQLGCKYANWEQDLGIEGLRRSKLSYRPTFMLNKYTIRLQ